MRKLLRDQSGRLYEIPLLIMVLFLSVTIGLAKRSALKGLAYGFGSVFGLLLFLFVIAMISEGVSGLMEKESVKRVTGSKAFQAAWTIFVCLCGAAALAAFCAFVGIFLSGMASTPTGQLRIMQGLAGGGGLLGFIGTYRLRQRKPE